MVSVLSTAVSFELKATNDKKQAQEGLVSLARDFRNIIVWQEADNLVIDIYKVTGLFPPDKKFGLTSQLRRAALSAPANIAEGSGRSTLKDFLWFLHNDQGFLFEVEYYCHIAKRLDYINDETYANIETQRAKVGVC